MVDDNRATEQQSGSSDAAGISAPDAASFQYGWCKTDWKEGRSIRTDMTRPDFCNGDGFKDAVRSMLATLGLPLPNPEEIYRGTGHDLLFLNSHGVVVRIGPLDVHEMMVPGIVQPLGWLECDDYHFSGRNNKDKYPLTVAVYPGVALFETLPLAKQYGFVEECKMKLAKVLSLVPALLDVHYVPPLERDSIINLKFFVDSSGVTNGDVNSRNSGVVKVAGAFGGEINVPLHIDPDHNFNIGFVEPGKEDIAHARRNLHQGLMAQKDINKGDLLFNYLSGAFRKCSSHGMKFSSDKWVQAIAAHQPLRQMFWDAFSSEKAGECCVDVAKRHDFWKKCAEVTNRPQAVSMPMWKASVGADGKLSLKRQVVEVPQMVLYRPWTKETEDQVIQPLLVRPRLRAAVQRAYQEKIVSPLQQVARAVTRASDHLFGARKL